MGYNFNTTPQRTLIMKSIKGKETKPEILLRKALWKRGHRYRKNHSKLPGKPDILITKHRIAIFIDGEFWHGHNWNEKKQKIRTNRDYWVNKIEGNVKRDVENTEALKKLGYTVIRFWSNQINKDLYGCINTVESIIEDN